MNPNRLLISEVAIRRKHTRNDLPHAPRERRPLVEIHHTPRPVPARWYLRVKRCVDVLVASLLLIPAVPVILLAGLLVRLTSRGPAFYVQVRLGLHGRPFRIFKIRTMIDKCETLTGPRWAIPGDPRITPVGAVLRATHIDELPQLWNVIRGDMSLIGPRPERPEIVANLKRDLPDYDDRLAVRPGITGLAQVQLPPDTSVSSAADKLVLDRAYINRLGPWLDFRLILCTAMKLLGLGPKHCRWLIRDAIPKGFRPGHHLRRYHRAA
ncbi:MAG: sugar transferase [Gemmataceae bacterium]|nr:sugar transferase [Gemmataceae bacterium]